MQSRVIKFESLQPLSRKKNTFFYLSQINKTVKKILTFVGITSDNICTVRCRQHCQTIRSGYRSIQIQHISRRFHTGRPGAPGHPLQHIEQTIKGGIGPRCRSKHEHKHPQHFSSDDHQRAVVSFGMRLACLWRAWRKFQIHDRGGLLPSVKDVVKQVKTVLHAQFVFLLSRPNYQFSVSMMYLASIREAHHVISITCIS